MTAGLKLYEIGEALALLDEWLQEPEHQERLVAAGGDLEAIPELKALIEATEGEFKEKVERVALYIRQTLAEADAIDAEAKRLAARCAAKKRGAESLKRYLQAQMERANITRVDGLLCTVRTQANPPKVESTLDEAALRESHRLGAGWVTRKEVFGVDRDFVLGMVKQGSAPPEGITVTTGRHVRIA